MPRDTDAKRAAAFSAERAQALMVALRSRIEGEVRFDPGSRALYATDASNYRQVPIGVVIPRTIDAVITAVALCREHGAPIFARGGGTSLAGQTCNEAVVLDCSVYNMSESLFDMVRQHPDHATLPVVIISDTPEAADASLRARQARHVLLVPKPFTGSHVARALDELLSRPSTVESRSTVG